jgi:hypothetical protein
MKRSTATALGFAIAALVPIVTMSPIDPPVANDLGTYLVIVGIIYFWILGYMLIVGLPTYFLFKRWNLIRWWTLMLVGLLMGTLVGYVFKFPLLKSPVDSALIQGPSCSLSGLVFWLIWRLGKVTDINPVPFKRSHDARDR